MMPRDRAIAHENAAVRRLQRAADCISTLILDTDYPAVDVLIEIEKARDLCAELFPERLELFEMVYDSRFRRLWEQFRGGRLGERAGEG